MPFQIQNVVAYREEVLDELRKQAKHIGTETYKIIQSNPIYSSQGGRSVTYDVAMRTKLSRAQDCYNTLDEVLWYCYCYMPLHFDAFQRVMEIEADDASDEVYGNTFEKKVFNTGGDLLVIDVGCGPMTAGLALADWDSVKFFL